MNNYRIAISTGGEATSVETVSEACNPDLTMDTLATNLIRQGYDLLDSSPDYVQMERYGDDYRVDSVAIIVKAEVK